MPLRTAAGLGALLVVVLAVYAHVTLSGWCGYDDFHEAYRAQFFDGRDPARILTAIHFEPFMYRPVTSALQLITWQLSGHRPLGFRVRGLTMHLLAILAVYGIGTLLGRSRAIGLGAAALFAFNPEGNEAVVVAIWTNTTAYALFLGGLFCFVLATRRDEERAPWTLPLAGFFVLALLALFTYEPTIALFGVVALYLLAGLVTRTRPSSQFLAVLGLGSIIEIVAFFAVRRVLGVGSAHLLGFGTILKHLAQYLGALVLPVDFVLAHVAFGVPFPSRAAPEHLATIAPLLGASFVIVLALAATLLRRGSSIGRSEDRRTLVFLALCIPLVLVPIVPFRPQVSEFNLYLPSAFWAIALCLLFARLARSPGRYAIAVAILLVPAIAGVWFRNERVVSCARIVDRIEAALPTARWHTGDWHVRIATAPGATLSPRFGTYDYSGIQTIDVPNSGILGAQSALRLWSGNEDLDAAVVPSRTFGPDCRRALSCYYVWPDGRVEREPSS